MHLHEPITVGDLYYKMQLFFEKTYPYFLGLAAALVWYRFGVALPNSEALLGSSLTLGAILTGFMATAKAILMTLDSPIMQRIRSTNYLSDLVSYLGQAIWLSFGFTLFSLSGFFVDVTVVIYGVLWIFIGVTASAAFIRITNIMLKIIRHSP